MTSDRRAVILSTTLDLVAEQGVALATVDGIAARAGVSKATIYRHWASRAQLLCDACEALVADLPLPDTGELRNDLVVFCENVALALRDERMSCVLPSVLDAAQRDEDMARLRDEMVDRRRRPVREILVRAQRRGELPDGLDVELAIDLLTGPLFYRKLVSGASPPPGMVSRVVDAVLPGLRAGAVAQARRRGRRET